MIFGPTHSCCWSKKSRQKKMTECYSEEKSPSCEEWYKPVSSHIHGSGFLKKQNFCSWQIPFFFRNLELTSKIIWWNKYYKKQFYFILHSPHTVFCHVYFLKLTSWENLKIVLLTFDTCLENVLAGESP